MVEVLDPMVLGSKVCQVQVCEPCSLTIPVDVQTMFGDELVLGGDRQRLFVTLGQFSVIRLERPAQIIVPIVDYAHEGVLRRSRRLRRGSLRPFRQGALPGGGLHPHGLRQTGGLLSDPVARGQR